MKPIEIRVGSDQLTACAAVLQALGEGETVQYQDNDGVWRDYTYSIDLRETEVQRRIKPASSHRPWTPEEAPLGLIARQRDNRHFRGLLCYTSSDGVGVGPSEVSFERLLDEFEWYNPHAGVWKLCGIEVGP